MNDEDVDSEEIWMWQIWDEIRREEVMEKYKHKWYVKLNYCNDNIMMIIILKESGIMKCKEEITTRDEGPRTRMEQ